MSTIYKEDFDLDGILATFPKTDTSNLPICADVYIMCLWIKGQSFPFLLEGEEKILTIQDVATRGHYAICECKAGEEPLCIILPREGQVINPIVIKQHSSTILCLDT